ncbi:erythromycin esterase family protein [Paenibacillus ehimensis]|uniref:erythromycin esterase family protein n=1 Tax=Paenibacillus ehimensis TaxID=79264 RepID=UPI000FDBC1B3|nr:erythromycin esterase family protein [Paenibacillus ehimensis]
MHKLKWTMKQAVIVAVAAVCLIPQAAYAEVKETTEVNAPLRGSVEEYNLTWAKWIKSHAYALESIEPEPVTNGSIEKERFQDLTFLKPLLMDKRIVYLGENSHGVAEYNQVKTRLIQYLHEELGFDVIAFESGMGNAAGAYARVGSRSPEELMKDTIFGVWWSKETLPLFDYIKQSAGTERPLAVSGFDMQVQFPYASFMKEWIGTKDTGLADAFVKAENELADWGASKDAAAYAQAKPRLLKTYEDTKAFLADHAAELQTQYPKNKHLVEMTQRVMDDRIRVVKEYTEVVIRSNTATEQGDYEPFLQTMRMRDEMMADNLTWLADHIYPDKKIIVWGHNDHVRKNNSRVMNSPYSGLKLMGELMPEKLKKQSYTIGLYMYEGEAANNMGQTYMIGTHEPGSLEHILKQAGHSYTFVDLKYWKNKKGTSWMFQPRVSLDWGMMPESMIPREQFDGLLLIDKVHPPAYIRTKP